MRAFGALLCIAMSAALTPGAAWAAGQCGPLQRLMSVDTVTGPAGYMLVPVRIGDAQRLMLFDTGGSISAITQAAAQDLRLPTYDSRVKIVGVSGAASTRSTIIPSITIGTSESKRAQYMVLPGDILRGANTSGVIGILAPAPGVDIDVDFAAHKLSFFSPDHCDGKVVYWQATAVAVVPMRIAGVQARTEFSTEHIIVPVTLDGKSLDALIDTGSTNNALKLSIAQERFGVDVNAPDVQPLGQLGNNASAKIYRKRFGTLSFEGVTVTNPVMDLLPDEQTRGLGDERRTGSLTRPSDRGLPDLIIGMPVLSKMHMYIAYHERKVYITAGADPAQVQTASLTQPPPAAAAPAGLNFNGSWKIASRPVRPVCEMNQEGDRLKGSCTGPAAKGELTGTVAGQTVRWQWKRVANSNGAASLWNFSGTVSGENTITGFLERNGRSAPFTATKQ